MPLFSNEAITAYATVAAVLVAVFGALLAHRSAKAAEESKVIADRSARAAELTIQQQRAMFLRQNAIVLHEAWWDTNRITPAKLFQPQTQDDEAEAVNKVLKAMDLFAMMWLWEIVDLEIAERLYWPEFDEHYRQLMAIPGPLPRFEKPASELITPATHDVHKFIRAKLQPALQQRNLPNAH